MGWIRPLLPGAGRASPYRTEGERPGRSRDLLRGALTLGDLSPARPSAMGECRLFPWVPSPEALPRPRTGPNVAVARDTLRAHSAPRVSSDTSHESNAKRSDHSAKPSRWETQGDLGPHLPNARNMPGRT